MGLMYGMQAIDEGAVSCHAQWLEAVWPNPLSPNPSRSRRTHLKSALTATSFVRVGTE